MDFPFCACNAEIAEEDLQGTIQAQIVDGMAKTATNRAKLLLSCGNDLGPDSCRAAPGQRKFIGSWSSVIVAASRALDAQARLE